MANIKSQIKRNLTNERRRLRNRIWRSELRTRKKNAIAAAAAGTPESADTIRLAIKRIDMAASKGIIHKNKAARDKSRLMARVAAKPASE